MLWAMRGRQLEETLGLHPWAQHLFACGGQREGEVQGDVPLLVCKSRKEALLAEVRGTGGRMIWGEINASGTQVWPCRK